PLGHLSAAEHGSRAVACQRPAAAPPHDTRRRHLQPPYTAAIVSEMRLVSALALTLLTPTTGAGQQAKAPDMPHLSPEVLAGLATTLSSSAAYDRQSHLGPSFSAGFWYGSEPRYSLGASYELFGLGSGASQRGVDSIEARYAAHALWAAGRLY